MTTLPPDFCRSMAFVIANDLFTNGNGNTANRLVLELPHLADGGGLCRRAVVDRIADHLAAAELKIEIKGETDAKD